MHRAFFLSRSVSVSNLLKYEELCLESSEREHEDCSCEAICKGLVSNRAHKPP
jgi:hypothetical protein